jgi:hypothetical protein
MPENVSSNMPVIMRDWRLGCAKRRRLISKGKRLKISHR